MMAQDVTAASLTIQQRKRTVNARKNKTPAVKSVLCTPYVAKWPEVECTSQQHILELIKRHAAEPAGGCLDVPVKRESNQLLRRHQDGLVCGVQNVTRCLEQDKLRLVLVDRSSPWQLHQHLTQLSAVRQCPAVAVDNMAATLCSILGVTRLSALGFKKRAEASVFEELVEYVRASCPSIDLPWLETQRGLASTVTQQISAGDDECDIDTPAPTVSHTRKSDKPDYCHLYIYKKDSLPKRLDRTPRRRRNLPAAATAEYLSLTPSSSSSDEDETLRRPRVADAADKDNDRDTETGDMETSSSPDATRPHPSSSYQRPNVGLQVPNPEKKRKEKQRKC